MDKIIYIIKFVQKLDYAEQLINGFLYMRTANYYKYQLEDTRGDIYEGTVSHKVMISKNTNHYIFCVFKITKQMIDDNYVLSRELVEHFNCKNGYAVIIKFDEFSNALSEAKNQVYELKGRDVSYGVIRTLEVTKILLIDNSYKSLCVKPPMYRIENEYRFISGKTNDDDNIPFLLNLGKSIDSFSKIISLKQLFNNRKSVPISEFILKLK